MTNSDWIEGTDLSFLEEHYGIDLTSAERHDMLALDVRLRREGAARLDFLGEAMGLGRRRGGVLEAVWQLPRGIILFATTTPELVGPYPYADVASDFAGMANQLVQLNVTTKGKLPSEELVALIKGAGQGGRLRVVHHHGAFDTGSLGLFGTFLGMRSELKNGVADLLNWIEGQQNIPVYGPQPQGDRQIELISFVARGNWLFVCTDAEDDTANFRGISGDSPEELLELLEKAVQAGTNPKPSRDAVSAMQAFIERRRRNTN